jgi:hypothetical protein
MPEPFGSVQTDCSSILAAQCAPGESSLFLARFCANIF